MRDQLEGPAPAPTADPASSAGEAASTPTKRPFLETLSVTAVALDGSPPLVKQIPVLLLFLVAVGLSFSLPAVSITSVPALVAAVILMIAATTLAAVLPRVNPSGRLIAVVPAIDFFIVGVLRHATGESASIFASGLVLPLVWMATLPERRYVVYSFLGVCVALLMPFLLGSSLENNPNEIPRSLFSAVAFGLAATVINDLARYSRDRIRDIRAREQRTLVELEEASAVQQALLPRDGGGTAGYQFAGLCLPSKSISGDFFDWYRVTGGTAFTLGDVMGKGVGAGIIAATLRAVVRSARNDDDPSVAMIRASKSIASDLADAETFATMLHGRLDASTGIIRYVNGGHGLSMHIRADGSWTRLESSDLPVGILFDEPWTVLELQLQPGETLVSCSDGILDVYDGTVASLGHIAYIISVSSSASNAITRMRSLINDSVLRDDDATVLVIHRPAVS